jgi:hypothetical protein
MSKKYLNHTHRIYLTPSTFLKESDGQTISNMNNFEQFRKFRTISNNFEQFRKFRTISNNFEQFRTISNNFEQFRTISNNFEQFQTFSNKFQTALGQNQEHFSGQNFPSPEE